MTFGHENFEAYQLSIQFLRVASELMESIPRGNSHLKDQLRRASTSISLNIAEGSGKIERNERNRFNSIARGSAMECAAICDVLTVLDQTVDPKTEEGKRMLASICRILSSVCSKARVSG